MASALTMPPGCFTKNREAGRYEQRRHRRQRVSPSTSSLRNGLRRIQDEFAVDLGRQRLLRHDALLAAVTFFHDGLVECRQEQVALVAGVEEVEAAATESSLFSTISDGRTAARFVERSRQGQNGVADDLRFNRTGACQKCRWSGSRAGWLFDGPQVGWKR